MDLARLAGLIPAGVICEVMKDDGTMARVPDLIAFCQEHGLKMLTVAELIRHRLQHERYIVRVAESRDADGVGRVPHDRVRERGAWRGEPCGAGARGCMPADGAADAVLVRVHSHCLAGDVFGTTLCDCQRTMEQSLKSNCGGGTRSADLSAQREPRI